jgi:hypothetical protein
MQEFFAPLPQDFDQLAHTARTKRGGGFGKDPDLRTVGERTYSAFERVAFAPNSPTPRQRDWRHIPYALWLATRCGTCKCILTVGTQLSATADGPMHPM